MRRRDSRMDAATHACALLLTAMMLVLLGKVLLRLPEAGSSQQTRERMQLRLLSRELAPAPASSPAASPLRPLQPSHTLEPEPARADAAVGSAPLSPAVPITVPARPSLFDPQGRVKVAIEAPATGVADAASRMFERRDPLQRGVGERATADLFSGQRAGTRQTSTQRAIYGRDIQAAEARRPPDVAFTPGLHERPSDLGSEATGDAYKAAAIRFEKAPKLDGEASRRIRAGLEELEKQGGRCAPAARQRWMAPVSKHLDELQRLEYRYAHGADPLALEHTLPSAADSAYDLARRALWYAERQMASCSG